MYVLRTTSLLVILLSLCAFFTPPVEDEKATNILITSEQQFTSLGDFYTRFSHKINSPSQRRSVESTEGELRYQKGMYQIDLPQRRIFCDLKYHWFVDSVEQRVKVNQIRYSPLQDVTQEIIFPIYRNKSRSRYLGEEMIVGEMCDKLVVSIPEASVSYHKAYVWVNRASHLITKIAHIDSRQTISTYTFFDIRLNQGYSQETFTFVGGD